MKGVLEELGTAVRWFASAFVGFIVTWIIDDEHNILSSISNTLPSWWLFLLGVLTIGVLFYSCHKAGFHPILFRLIVLPCSRFLASRPSYQQYILLDFQRSSRRDFSISAVQNIQRDLDNWANIPHFLYCSGWTSITVPILILHWMGEAKDGNWLLAVGFSAIWVTIALYSDCRQTAREVWLSDNLKNIELVCGRHV